MASSGVSRLVFGGALSAAFPSPQYYCLLTTHPEEDSRRCSASSDIPGLVCSRTHLSIFLAVRRALLQHRPPGESVVSYQPSLSSARAPAWDLGVRGCAPSQPWSLTTSLLLAISANSSATARQSLSLLVMSWLQSPFTLTTEPG